MWKLILFVIIQFLLYQYFHISYYYGSLEMYNIKNMLEAGFIHLFVTIDRKREFKDLYQHLLFSEYFQNKFMYKSVMRLFEFEKLIRNIKDSHDQNRTSYISIFDDARSKISLNI